MEEGVEITGIAAGGAGVGRLSDGRVTFVHRTAPGDRAVVRVVESRPRWTRSRLVRIEQASPDRREAPCPHYDRCGGCTLEHLRYDAQRAAKARIVEDALRRIGTLDVRVADVVPSPAEFRYRNRVSFTLRRGPDVMAGFHELEEPDRIVDVTGACLLPEEPIARAWDGLRSAWGPEACRLPSGDTLRLTLRSTAGARVGLAVDGGYAPGRPAELLAAVTQLESIWHRPASARSFRLLAGEERLPDTWAEEDVALSGDVFTQVNRGAAALLEAHVVERLAVEGTAHVVDAYCGIGLTARKLARAGIRVTGIEAHPQAVAEARRAMPSGRFIEGRVEDRLGEALPADAVLLNPPRTGLDARVPAVLRRAGPERVVYVSCDPATLARDLKRLGDAYVITEIRCFDLFPQTAHVETVVGLRRTDGDGSASGPGQ